MLYEYVEQQISTLLAEHDTAQLWVAYSGGLDSTVLLALMKQYCQNHGKAFKALHINHQLSPNASNWVIHAQTVCQQANIPIITKQIRHQPPKGQSLEDWARTQRHVIFKQLAENTQTPCIFLLGHHQQDQSETFLLNALRGASPKGLGSLTFKRAFEHYTIVRPLLAFSREDIQAYAQSHQLNWIEDESNQQSRFDRNYLRHHVLPILNQRWRQTVASLARSATLCYENNQLLESYIDTDLAHLYLNDHKKTIYLKPLQQFETSKQKCLMIRWFFLLTKQQLPHNTLEHIIQQLPTIHSGWSYQCNHHYVLQCHQNTLTLVKQTKPCDEPFCYQWYPNQQSILIEPLNQTLTKNELIDFGIDEHKINNVSLIIRSRAPGDYCKPAYRQKSNKLKILFQECGISKWQRKQAIVIANKKTGKILAVYPFFLCS